jgi:hypothetical protein
MNFMTENHYSKSRRVIAPNQAFKYPLIRCETILRRDCEVEDFLKSERKLFKEVRELSVSVILAVHALGDASSSAL